MGLGTDLMRFFAKDAPLAADADTTLRTFHEQHATEYPYPAVNLRAARQLSTAGRLIEGGPGLGAPIFSARFQCTRTLAELRPDLDYGTFDFIVDGFAVIRDAFRASVFFLQVETASGSISHGSTFAILPNLLLTARHCVENARRVAVVLDDDSEVEPVRVLLSDDGSDVAGLLFGPDLASRGFRVREPELLEPVMTMGFPTLQGFHPALMASVGELSGIGQAYLDGHDYWITTCAMTGGSSGGPIVAGDGSVVGVVSGLPATDAGIDPGRFGMMVPCSVAVADLAQQIAASEGPPGVDETELP